MVAEEFSEIELIEDVLHGDEVSLRHFYKSYKDKLTKFIIPKISISEDAEEIVQDVFIDSLDALRNFNYKSSVYTFLCSIAKYKIIDYYRRKKISNVVFSRIPENLVPLISSVLNPEDAYSINELKSQINNVFDKLKPTYRQILKLKYIYGYSIKEIALKMALTLKGAESMLFRARSQFSKQYNLLYV